MGNIFRRFLNAIRTNAENFLSLTVPLWNQGPAMPSRFDTRKFISEAFEGNPLCYAATMEIATSMAEAPLRGRLKGSKEAVSDANPLARILERPNDFQSMPELVIETTAQLMCSGNSHWAMELNDLGMPLFMQALPIQEDQTRPFFSNGKLFYEFHNWGGKKEIFPAERILHFKESPDLNDPLMRGMPPIVPIRRFIDMHNVLARYVDDFFHNNAVPPALLIFKNKLTPTDVERVTKEMKEKHATPGKYHSLGISFGDAKLERLGITVKDLDIEPVLRFVETSILQAFNISPILVGATAAMGVSGWGNNFQEARKMLQSENLAPRRRLMEQILNRGLASKFGSRYEIYFDETQVYAMQEDKAKKKEFALAAWNGGAYTRNQFLRDCGEKEISGAEGEMYKPQNTGGSGTFVTDKPKPNGKAVDVPMQEEAVAS